MIIGNPFGVSTKLVKIRQSIPELSRVFVNNATDILKAVNRARDSKKGFISFVSKRLAPIQMNDGFQIHCKVLVVTVERKCKCR